MQISKKSRKFIAAVLTIFMVLLGNLTVPNLSPNKAIVLAEPDNTELANAIIAANALKASKPVGTEVGNVSQDAYDTYGTAITTALTICATTNTAVVYDAALSTLNAATTTFKNSILVAGSNAALEAAIATATSLANSTVVGQAPGQVPKEAKDTYLAAIGAASAISSTVKTQGEYDAAVQSLAAATAMFQSSIISNLPAARAAAETLLDQAGTNVGSGEGQYPPAAFDAFGSAIYEAVMVESDPQATPNDKEAALAELLAAQSRFLASMNTQVPTTGYTAKPEITLGVYESYDEETVAYDNKAGVYVGIKEIHDAQGNLVPDALLAGYQVDVVFDRNQAVDFTAIDASAMGSFLVNHKPESNRIRVIDASEPGIDHYQRLFFVPLAFTGPSNTTTNVSIKFNSAIDSNLNYIAIPEVNLTFQRGKILNETSNRTTGLADVVAGLQYLVGKRDPGILPGTVNVVNMASIMPRETGQTGFRPTIQGVIMVMQQIVELRDEWFRLIASEPSQSYFSISVTSVDVMDDNGNKLFDAGDKVRITFSNAIASEVVNGTSSQIALGGTLQNSQLFGSNPVLEWRDSKTLDITAGANPTAILGSSSILSKDAIWNAEGKHPITDVQLPIPIDMSDVAPYIKNYVAVDMNQDNKLDGSDFIRLEFNKPLAQDSKQSLASHLAADAVLGQPSVYWENDKLLRITISGTRTEDLNRVIILPRDKVYDLDAFHPAADLSVTVATLSADSDPDLTVTGIAAVASDAIDVLFNRAPADITKVTFAVTRGSTLPVEKNVTWDETRTVATLKSAYILAEGNYNVSVKNGTTDLGKQTVAITEWKIAKIEFTSTVLGLAGKYVTGEVYPRGYASYKVLDQYGNDISTTYLAKNIAFQSGVGAVTGFDGLLTITPYMNLSTLASVVVTASDSNTGATANATLSLPTVPGTLSDIKLNKLTNAENKVLIDGDTSSVFYIDYTATDLSGNPTKDYQLVKNGLITQYLYGYAPDFLTSSLSQVTAQVIQDPLDSKKAAIEVRVMANPAPILLDQPVTITAMTYGGSTSKLETTLKSGLPASEAPRISDKIFLMAPPTMIAVDEVKEIPFEVFDQNNNKVTGYAELVNMMGLIGGAYLVENADGTGRIMVQAQPFKGPQTVMAMTPNNEIATVTLNIADAAKADSLSVDTTGLVTTMQIGSAQRIDGGWFKGGISVKDQYGRPVDIWTFDVSNKLGQLYQVYAMSSNPSVITTSGSAGVGNGGITIAAVNPGTATVYFELRQMKTYNPAGSMDVLTAPYTIASKTVTFSVVPDSDIAGYTITPVSDPIYTAAPATLAQGSTLGYLKPETMRMASYAANPKIYAATASGTRVLPRDFTDLRVYLDSSDFIYDTDTDNYIKHYGTTPQAFDGIRVIAKEFGYQGKTEGFTNVTATFTGADGKIRSLSTTVRSTTALPVAQSLNLYVSKERNGVTVNDAMDEVTLYSANGGLSTLAPGRIITRWDANGDQGAYYSGYWAGRAPFHFYTVDQYNSKGQELAQIIVTPDAFTGHTIFFAADGTIAFHDLVVGDAIRITAVTRNGLIKTIKVIVR